ncbi:tripartite tricarboxylate transporter substrate-binding protein [Pseudoroseomonas wenyumeiae]
MVVENRAGGNGIIGTDLVAKAPADGHTLACTSIVHAVNAPLYRTPYDVLKDVPAVTILYSVPLVLVTAPDLPVSNLGELIALAKRSPEKATCVGTGGLYCAMFNMLAGTDIEQIPYRGSTAAHPDLMAGRVGFMVDTMPAALGHVQSGKLKALAVPSPQRIASLPDVPSMPEAGLPDFIASSWGALLAPAGVSPAIAQKIADDSATALRAPEMRSAWPPLAPSRWGWGRMRRSASSPPRSRAGPASPRTRRSRSSRRRFTAGLGSLQCFCPERLSGRSTASSASAWRCGRRR